MNSFTLHLFPTGTKQGELHLLFPTVMVLVIIIIDRAGFSHDGQRVLCMHRSFGLLCSSLWQRGGGSGAECCWTWGWKHGLNTVLYLVPDMVMDTVLVILLVMILDMLLYTVPDMVMDTVHMGAMSSMPQSLLGLCRWRQLLAWTRS